MCVHQGKDYCYQGISAAPETARLGAGKSRKRVAFSSPTHSLFLLLLFDNMLFYSHVHSQVFFKVEKIRNLHLRSSELCPSSLLLEIKDKSDETMQEISSRINVLPCLYYI